MVKTSFDLLKEAEQLVEYVERHEDKGWTKDDTIVLKIAQTKTLIAIHDRLKDLAEILVNK